MGRLAMILGIIGAVVSAVGYFVTIGEFEDAPMGFLGVPLAIVGLVGALLTMRNPLIGGIVMALAAALGFVLVFAGFLYGGPILLVAGVLAIVAAVRRGGREAAS